MFMGLIPANDDPAHPRPMSRADQIAFIEGAEQRHAAIAQRWANNPAYQNALRRRAERFLEDHPIPLVVEGDGPEAL